MLSVYRGHAIYIFKAMYHVPFSLFIRITFIMYYVLVCVQLCTSENKNYFKPFLFKVIILPSYRILHCDTYNEVGFGFF